MVGLDLAAIVDIFLRNIGPGIVVKTFDSQNLVGMQGAIFRFSNPDLVLRYDRTFSDVPYFVSENFRTGMEAYIKINGVLRPFFGDKLPIMLFSGDLREIGQDHVLDVATSKEGYISIRLKGNYKL